MYKKVTWGINFFFNINFGKTNYIKIQIYQESPKNLKLVRKYGQFYEKEKKKRIKCMEHTLLQKFGGYKKTWKRNKILKKKVYLN